MAKVGCFVDRFIPGVVGSPDKECLRRKSLIRYEGGFSIVLMGVKESKKEGMEGYENVFETQQNDSELNCENKTDITVTKWSGTIRKLRSELLP